MTLMPMVKSFTYFHLVLVSFQESFDENQETEWYHLGSLRDPTSEGSEAGGDLRTPAAWRQSAMQKVNK